MTGMGNFIFGIAMGTLAAICLFILALLAGLMLRRNAPFNSTPNTASRQTPRELIWTAALLVVVAVVAVPALRLWYFKNTNPATDLTIEVTGKMWSWTYRYPDDGNFSFEAPMLANKAPGKSGEFGQPGTGNHIVVPVGKTVRILAMGTNLIYSWAIPSIGARVKALPGQTRQSWFKATKEGRYYGECFELCGLPHAFRPIEVEVVSPERFDRWVAEMRVKPAAAGAFTRVGED
jgi:cytochrome c oxidase subunit 2